MKAASTKSNWQISKISLIQPLAAGHGIGKPQTRPIGRRPAPVIPPRGRRREGLCLGEADVTQMAGVGLGPGRMAGRDMGKAQLRLKPGLVEQHLLQQIQI